MKVKTEVGGEKGKYLTTKMKLWIGKLYFFLPSLLLFQERRKNGKTERRKDGKMERRKDLKKERRKVTSSVSP